MGAHFEHATPFWLSAGNCFAALIFSPRRSLCRVLGKATHNLSLEGVGIARFLSKKCIAFAIFDLLKLLNSSLWWAGNLNVTRPRYDGSFHVLWDASGQETLPGTCKRFCRVGWPNLHPFYRESEQDDYVTALWNVSWTCLAVEGASDGKFLQVWDTGSKHFCQWSGLRSIGMDQFLRRLTTERIWSRERELR